MIVVKKGRNSEIGGYIIGNSKGVEKTYKLSDDAVAWVKSNNIDVGDEITNDSSAENKGFTKDDKGVITLTNLILVQKANMQVNIQEPHQSVLEKETKTVSNEEITFLIEAMEDLLGKLKSSLLNKQGA